MVVELKTYDSAVRIAEAIEEEITRTKILLGEYLRRLDVTRAMAERSKKIRQVAFKLAGKKASHETLGEVTVGSIRVVLDANPIHELTAIEEVVRFHQERLLDLEKSRKSMKWMDQIGNTEGIKCLVVERDGIPKRVLLKISYSPPEKEEG